ncbi:MAG: hypothetical protein AAF202_02585 [Pseudomonadota bacterium]
MMKRLSISWLVGAVVLFTSVGAFELALASSSHSNAQAQAQAQELSDQEEKVSYSGIAVPYDQKERMIGKAYWKSDTKKLAYVEEHTFFYLGQQRVKVETVYKWPTGEKFADFVSDYTKHPYIPAYRFRDRRYGRVEGLEWLDSGKVRVYGRKYHDHEMKSAEIDPPAPGFAGQGLNFFIVDNFLKLSSRNEPLEVGFVVPIAQKSYGFRIKTRGEPDGKVVKFRAEIDNWFIRLFAPSIDVLYDAEKKVLLEYRGPSNLLNNNKDIKPVVIKYDTSELSIQQASRPYQLQRRDASISSGEAQRENP